MIGYKSWPKRSLISVICLLFRPVQKGWTPERWSIIKLLLQGRTWAGASYQEGPAITEPNRIYIKRKKKRAHKEEEDYSTPMRPGGPKVRRRSRPPPFSFSFVVRCVGPARGPIDVIAHLRWQHWRERKKTRRQQARTEQSAAEAQAPRREILATALGTRIEWKEEKEKRVVDKHSFVVGGARDWFIAVVVVVGRE